ncbi:hypothetical protein [Cardinium endosymbiont of Nabis limbatus]|uniref:hypothetical protein n=1 Tax=Cardinium endosymbiont of Nabis limbatus TaxID=3066217 RepID=UPI003AF3A12B
MSYPKRAAALFFMTLFLEASSCLRKTIKSSPIPHQSADLKLALVDATTEKPVSAPELDTVPEFDAEFGADYKMHQGAGVKPNSGYDTGHATDSDAPSRYKINKAAGMEPNAGYDSGYETDPEFDKKDITFDFERSIQGMREAADEQRGIRWRLSGDELTRHVGDNSNSSSLYAGEDYVVMALNIYRAAKKIFELHKKDGVEFVEKAYKLIKYYHDYPEKTEDSWINTIKKINATVLLHLQNNLFQDKAPDWINEKLRLAENYIGLDDTHYNITTTFTINGKKFALEDKKWLPLTEKQKRDYINRKSESWYDRLDLFEQKLIDAYLDKLLDGKHYIPTQLRSIPGCRNAYQKRVLAYDDNNNPIELGRYYHSGSFVSPIEWAEPKDQMIDFQQSKDNWEQIQAQTTKQGKTIEAISLNYEMNLAYNSQIREKKIVADAKNIIPPGQFMNISINEISTLFNVNNKIDELIQEILVYYKADHPNVYKAFFPDDTEKKSCINWIKKMLDRIANHSENYINQAIEKVKDPKIKRLFQEVATLKESVGYDLLNNIKHTMSITGNRNADIAASYTACKAILGEANPSTSKVLFFCKSGKDRTGVKSYLVDGKIIQINYPTSAEISDIYKTLAYTGHYQFLASVNGGMPGRFGMKPVKGNEQMANFRKVLFPRAAIWTKINPSNQHSEESDDGLDTTQPIAQTEPSTKIPIAG